MHGLGGPIEVGCTAAGVVHVGNVSRCGSPWACPVCEPTIAERRASEIDQAAAEWVQRGGSVWFVTATLRHELGDELGELLELVQSAWSATWRFKERPWWYGGMVRAVEVTHGGNGWHPHMHAAVFVGELRPGPNPHGPAGWVAGLDPAATLRRLHRMRWAWEHEVERRGGTTSVRGGLVDEAGLVRRIGWDVVPCTFADGATQTIGGYLAKVHEGWGLGLEIARAGMKRGRRKGQTPAQLLAAAVEGDQAAARLFEVYERATAGRRRIVASRGLYRALAVRELSDDEAANAAPDDAPVAELRIPSSAWFRLLRCGEAAAVLDDLAALVVHGEAWRWPAVWLSRAGPALVT
jgi:hypothetical protein